MMISGIRLSIIFCLFCSIYGTFYIKNAASAAAFQLAETKYQITQEQNNIHVLKAEVALLSSPQNISKLASKHLNLEQLKFSHIISHSQIELGAKTEQNNNPSDVFETDKAKKALNLADKPAPKWRYKQPIYKQAKHEIDLKKNSRNQNIKQ